ncbi:MAG: exodeoxyribonuclease VII small subunit [Candidatus Firestonebacteria bacterium RIFOXYC2_FULL_39_67]|nr:MAG: exodeoxyribonuclease VII small subunit [Candidatus Firestonebacteria bacterium RIFOXYD2_FULL_39_29]OGF56395.1 MAG: exodeoxyribonuclease VII small subunit [Candidatus Firestonebacteria bacterium RIFOXYC2_FULL_39_67]
MADKEVKFESALEKLEEIVDKLESGDIGLDESIKQYEEGMKLLKFCTAKLDEVEKKIEVLVKDKGGKVTGSKPFKNEEAQDKLL